jgi:hypothetical protein
MQNSKTKYFRALGCEFVKSKSWTKINGLSVKPADSFVMQGV